MYYQVFSPIYQLAAQKMCRDCQQFIKKNSKILDLGCGSAIVGKKFQKHFQAEILGVDIIDKRVEKIPFQLYNGRNLHFPDNCFDTVLISYVLHHAKDPKCLLKEAKRVTNDKIIIYEDLPEGFLSKIRCKIHGITFASFFQKNRETGNFKTENEWEKLFEDIGLVPIFKKKISNFPFKREMFVLRINKE